MADEAQLSPFVFACQGGLVLDQSTFAMQPGMALELQNFEPDISGGYRRISGYAKWNSNIVPQTAADTEPVLMVALFNSKVIAARGTKIYEAGTTGSWSEIDTGRTGAGRYTFFRYNLAGTDFIIWADGATAYGYQYRGEAQQYGINFARFEEGIKHMQSILINRDFTYVRSTFLPHSQRYGVSIFPTGT